MKFVAVAILTAFFFAPILHDVLPHIHTDHDHGSTDTTSVVWTTLHQAARHEDKKLALLFFFVAIIPLAVISVGRPLYRMRRETRRVPNVLLAEYLFRGVLPSRRFR